MDGLGCRLALVRDLGSNPGTRNKIEVTAHLRRSFRLLTDWKCCRNSENRHSHTKREQTLQQWRWAESQGVGKRPTSRCPEYYGANQNGKWNSTNKNLFTTPSKTIKWSRYMKASMHRRQAPNSLPCYKGRKRMTGDGVCCRDTSSLQGPSY